MSSPDWSECSLISMDGTSSSALSKKAVKVLGPSQLHVVEFDPDTGAGSNGTVVVDSVIELKPTVTGIE